MRDLYLWSCCSLLLMLASPARAQYFDSGQDPASTRWQTIHTQHFELVFPESYHDKARKLAFILEEAYHPLGNSLSSRPARIPVIIHNYSNVSNGYVAWAPKRVELFPTPAQDESPGDWLAGLAIHEFRHVVQIEKVNQGFTKALALVLGQQAVGAVLVFVPLWFLEGDAVWAETAFTRGGRGREPRFEMEWRAHWLEKGTLLSYSKSYLGSYRDHVPDYYQLGYQLVTFARLQHGMGVFQAPLDFTARYPFSVFPFGLGSRKSTGYKNLDALYRAAFHFLDSAWRAQEVDTARVDGRVWSQQSPRDHISYRSPSYLNDSTVLAMKMGQGFIPRLVKIDKDGKETRVHVPGLSSSGRYSVGGGMVAFDERVPDPRWQNRGWSSVKLYQPVLERELVLSHGKRWFAPALSPDGSLIAAVENMVSGDCNLVILDVAHARQLSEVPAPEGERLQYPSWGAGNDRVFCTATGNAGKRLVSWSVVDSTWREWLPPSMIAIRKPVQAGKWIFFEGDFQGIPQLFALDTLALSIGQVTRARFGAFHVSVSPAGDKLLYSEYTSSGYQVVEIPIEPESWIPYERVKDFSPKMYLVAAGQENQVIDTEPPVDFDPGVQRFRKSRDLFQFHSWMPFYFDASSLDPLNTPVLPGITVLSQNKLSTLFTQVGYAWDGDHHGVYTRVRYAGLYPVLDLSSGWGGGYVSGVENEQLPLPSYKTPKQNYSLRVYLPLDYTRGRYITGARPLVRFSYNDGWFFYPSRGNYRRGMGIAEAQLYVYRYERPSRRDIFPRTGGSVLVQQVSTPLERERWGNAFIANGSLYLPGFMENQAFRFRARYHVQEPRRYYLSVYASMPRGSRNLLARESFLFSVDYASPLWYPDLEIGPLFYLKRVRGAAFHDISSASTVYQPGNPGEWLKRKRASSTGVEILLDFHLLRAILPLSAGTRLVYDPVSKGIRVEGIFSIDTNFF